VTIFFLSKYFGFIVPCLRENGIFIFGNFLLQKSASSKKQTKKQDLLKECSGWFVFLIFIAFGKVGLDQNRKVIDLYFRPHDD
jgi:hypothetical protein